ncbi:MAG: SPOR domain-containing protein [Calditerrivibrio sp.]|nr:SPOR domain-containing protein [Calditerrivibrio sp.]
MKDTGKIKEKESKGEVKVIFFVGIVFLVAFGLIIYGIVKLTNQYFTLKEQISEKNALKQTQTTTPDAGKKITIDSENIKVEDIKKKTDAVVSDNKPAKVIVEEKKPETKTKPESEKPISKQEQSKQDQTNKELKQNIVEEKPTPKAQEPKSKVVLNADNAPIKKVDTPKPTEKNEQKEKTAKQDQPAKQEKKEAVDKKETKPQDKNNNIKIAQKDTPKQVTEKTKQENNNKTESQEKKDAIYSLQLMAFKDEEHTKKEAEKLKSKIKDVYIVKADLGEKGIWYRIRCCKNLTKEEAIKMKEKLQRELGINAILAVN